MKKILIFISLLLAGCQTPVIITQSLPVPPIELTRDCVKLNSISSDTVTLSMLMETVAKNYTLYHQCQAQHAAMVEWYKKQKEIFDELND